MLVATDVVLVAIGGTTVVIDEMLVANGESLVRASLLSPVSALSVEMLLWVCFRDGFWLFVLDLMREMKTAL